MVIDLKNMSRKELEKLGRDVEKALTKLQRQDVKKVRLEMEKLAAAHGLSVEEVIGSKASSSGKAKTKSSTPKAKSAPKYANPADATQTWTGKGRQPEWFKSAMAAGADPESMAI